ncbi:hypothetical protein [Marixanthomonas ophiurae]|uniref:SGNH/GDSL hydrolase family protein n=1 Tax=Marixanthomonas ophiurae TaxID=387659 RepID=A0A3E1QD32_9FLAO|nr:hypothetical protein [Marixanthomonas ophiurae]RFN60055.1 hypothetical protein DZ858_08405 [Marixanthomonas ophiurae]
MKTFFKHIAVLVLAFLALANVVSMVSLWSLRNGSFYKPSFLANQVPETQFDYIVLGASTGLTTLNTTMIDSIANIKGINLAMDDTGLGAQYLMLQHFLAEGKQTTYCVLAPGVLSYDNMEEAVSDNDYRFLMYINRPYVNNHFSEIKKRDQRVKMLQATKWFPMSGVSYFNAELFWPSLVSILKPNRHNRFDAFGNYTYPKKNRKFSDSEKKERTIRFVNPYLKKIKSLCKANNIQLIYYLSPLRNTAVRFSEKEVPVIDHTGLIQDDTFFYDDIHVNTPGREITSRAFAEAFKKVEK